jgi:hypothetical protein
MGVLAAYYMSNVASFSLQPESASPALRQVRHDRALETFQAFFLGFLGVERCYAESLSQLKKIYEFQTLFNFAALALK